MVGLQATLSCGCSGAHPPNRCWSNPSTRTTAEWASPSLPSGWICPRGTSWSSELVQFTSSPHLTSSLHLSCSYLDMYNEHVDGFNGRSFKKARTREMNAGMHLCFVLVLLPSPVECREGGVERVGLRGWGLGREHDACSLKKKVVIRFGPNTQLRTRTQARAHTLLGNVVALIIRCR